MTPGICENPPSYVMRVQIDKYTLAFSVFQDEFQHLIPYVFLKMHVFNGQIHLNRFKIIRKKVTKRQTVLFSYVQ